MMRGILLFSIFFSLFLFSGCTQEQIPEVNNTEELPFEIFEREEKIPENATKMTPELDMYPPILYSDEYYEPVPMDGPINSKGGEDSAFIAPDGNTFFFFFTPDVKVPVEKQLIDGTTGLYWSKKINGEWKMF